MINEQLPKEAYTYNGLTLAYMGDAVFELFARQHLLAQGNSKAHSLHKEATHYVSAKAQAHILNQLLKHDFLHERERDIVKRGRNAKSGTVPKNTPWMIYRLSTAFESLIGYLYLDEQMDRLQEVVEQSFEIIEERRGNHE